MKIAFFSTKTYDIQSFDPIAKNMNISIDYFEEKLSPKTAIMAKDYDATCSFVNDIVDSDTIDILKNIGIKAILLRCAGFDSVDLERAKEINMPVLRVPAYSPPSVAEHAVALLLAVNRKIHLANNRTKNFNFDINGLMGNVLRGKTAGVMGTGKIGKIVIEILEGFGMNLIAYDKYPDKNSNIQYVTLDDLLSKSNVITLHTPLNSETKYIINSDNISKMKDGVIIINTARGGLVRTQDLIEALEHNKLGGVGLDVYEHENEYFFEDHSQTCNIDLLLRKLLSFDKVILTGHQAFLTEESLNSIAKTTLNNLKYFLEKGDLMNDVNLYLNGIPVN